MKIKIKYDDLVISGGTIRMDIDVIRGGMSHSLGYWFTKSELSSIRDTINSYLETNKEVSYERRWEKRSI